MTTEKPSLQEVCNRTIEHIRRYGRVDQQLVVSGERDEHGNWCGTAACLAGHIVLAMEHPDESPDRWPGVHYAHTGIDWLSRALEYLGWDEKWPGFRLFAAIAGYWPDEPRKLYESGRREDGAILLLEMIRDGKYDPETGGLR